MGEPRSERPARRAGTDERLLIFRLGGQEFGIPLDSIVEIIRHRPPTPVPGAGGAVEGILALRGRMVTVFDARRRLGLEPRAGGGGARVIVLDDRGELVGLVVDGEARVACAPRRTREPLPDSLPLGRRDLYEGILQRDGGCVLLLNVGAITEVGAGAGEGGGA
ncbi:MAG: chemotaxis protein CheW [Acidobacteriota bacterium]